MMESRWVQLAVVVAVALPGLTACAGQGESAAESGDPPAAVEHDGSRESGEQGEAAEHGQGSEHEDGGEPREGGEHREGGERGEGEEFGEYIAQGATWDATRRGLRLRLSFDPASNAFTGTVENTTRETVCAVRVEVHLSGGIELGPTERADLAPEESTAVELPAGGRDFETWTAHPEQSSCPRQPPGPVSSTLPRV